MNSCCQSVLPEKLRSFPERMSLVRKSCVFSIPQDDEIVPQTALNFDLGRLTSISNESYFLAADIDEEEPGQRAREGRIFGEVPTSFDELTCKDFTQWE
jgi:hypothetical protein